jgi:hypothetical protein
MITEALKNHQIIKNDKIAFANVKRLKTLKQNRLLVVKFGHLLPAYIILPHQILSSNIDFINFLLTKSPYVL